MTLNELSEVIARRTEGEWRVVRDPATGDPFVAAREFPVADMMCSVSQPEDNAQAIVAAVNHMEGVLGLLEECRDTLVRYSNKHQLDYGANFGMTACDCEACSVKREVLTRLDGDLMENDNPTYKAKRSSDEYGPCLPE